jgi:ATP-dependent Clp protease ATP-binding subunit ClpA
MTIEEPSASDTKKILRGLKQYYSKFHGVEYHDKSLDLAVDLADRYIKTRFFPDKAIDIMDAAGAVTKLAEKDTVDELAIKEQAAKLSKIPIDMIDIDVTDSIKNMDIKLKTEVFGQDEAVNKITESFIVSKAGLREKNKPIGSFLLVGPSGVGKTHFAKELSKITGSKLVRFDMSEYQEKHSVSRLVGAPPGYVGHGEGKNGDGQLIQEVSNNPNCVLLLDEIEKAAPDVMTLLLQVMDDGRLTSSKGKTVDFSNAIILLTSNLGARDAEKNKIGFGDQSNSAAFGKAIKDYFPPEFRNRLDSTIMFNKLSTNEIKLIVNAELKLLNDTTFERKISVVATPNAKKALILQGFSDLMGARPLKRLIQNEIKNPLSRLMLFSGLKENGGTVKVDYVNNKFEVTVATLNPPKAQASLPAYPTGI